MKWILIILLFPFVIFGVLVVGEVVLGIIAGILLILARPMGG